MNALVLSFARSPRPRKPAMQGTRVIVLFLSALVLAASERDDGRLKTRPHAPAQQQCVAGLHLLGQGPRAPRVYIPASKGSGAAPFLLWFHGAGGNPEFSLSRL